MEEEDLMRAPLPTYGPPSPCYKCEDRKPGCHPGCERYLAWREIKQGLLQENLDKMENKSMLDRFMLDSYKRTSRRLPGREKKR